MGRMETVYYVAAMVAISNVIMVLLAHAGEPSAAWLVCEMIGFDQVCKGVQQ